MSISVHHVQIEAKVEPKDKGHLNPVTHLALNWPNCQGSTPPPEACAATNLVVEEGKRILHSCKKPQEEEKKAEGKGEGSA